ncbi:MAG: hypothetical protein Kow006_06080 [Gammaproteobacteria bacterium]
MRRPGFLEGVGIALVASVVGGILFPGLSAMLGGDRALRLMIAGMGLFYLLYLLSRSDERVGCLTAFAVWLVAALGLWLMESSLPLYVMMHLSLVGVVRSLYYHSSLISVLGDFGLVVLGLAAGTWALFETGNLFLVLWCFFLVQALFVFIPSRREPSVQFLATRPDVEDRFRHAQSVAEAALGRLFTDR